MILTDQHKPPPRLINTGTGTVSSAALIKQNDVARMSTDRLYRHESIGPGPYTDWELTSDAEGPLFTRQTRELTAEELSAELRQRWARTAEQKKRRIARRSLATPVDDDAVETRLRAIQTLTGVK